MLESPVSVWGRLPRRVRLLVFGSFVNRLGTFIVPYLALVLRREFHLSEQMVGVLMAAYGAGSISSILIGGHLTDRIGRRAALLLSLGGSAILSIGLSLATSLSYFAPLLVALGFLADLYRPASSALISDELPSVERATGFASLRMAINLGYAVGVAFGGLIADWHWRLLFAGDGLTTALFGLLVYFSIPETPRVALARPDTRVVAARPIADPVQLQITLTGFATCLVLASYMTTFPLTVSLSARYPARVYGSLVALNGLTIGVLEVTVVSYLRRFRRLRVAALGATLMGLGFGITGLVLHWAWFLLAVVLWTWGEILAMPQQMSFVADWAPPEARGRYMAFYQAAWSLALVLNPLLLMPLHARLPEAWFWPCLLVVTTPASLLLLHLDRVADRPERLRGRDEGLSPA
jgi:MFS family permease